MGKRILILCTGNSCRSQMAMGLLQSIDKDLVVCSAGILPTKEVNPYAIKSMAEIGIDISSTYPKNIDRYINEKWDYVITVCGNADENCPNFIGSVGKRLHIGFEDPASAIGTEEEILAVFRKVREEIKTAFQIFYIEEIKGLHIPKCCCNK